MRSFGAPIVAIAVAATLLAACGPRIPERAYLLTPITPAEDRLSTRWFETSDEDLVVRMARDVLRSSGYRFLDISDRKPGVLIAAKEADQTTGEVLRDVGMFTVVTTLTLWQAAPATQKHQEFRVMVRARRDQPSRTYLHATFYRVVWDTDNDSQSQTLEDPDLYRLFFSELSDRLSLAAKRL